MRHFSNLNKQNTREDASICLSKFQRKEINVFPIKYVHNNFANILLHEKPFLAFDFSREYITLLRNSCETYKSRIRNLYLWKRRIFYLQKQDYTWGGVAPHFRLQSLQQQQHGHHQHLQQQQQEQPQPQITLQNMNVYIKIARTWWNYSFIYFFPKISSKSLTIETWTSVVTDWKFERGRKTCTLFN